MASICNLHLITMIMKEFEMQVGVSAWALALQNGDATAL